jgi:hypothetical protein
MQHTSSRNQLRHAGRIPQETLDYLAAKERDDRRKRRIFEIPLLVIAAALLAFDIAMLAQSKAPLMSTHTFALATPGLLMATIFFRTLRRLRA